MLRGQGTLRVNKDFALRGAFTAKLGSLQPPSLGVKVQGPAALAKRLPHPILEAPGGQPGEGGLEGAENLT
eukprot:4080507-Pyramimonas_sp.AAC.2